MAAEASLVRQNKLSASTGESHRSTSAVLSEFLAILLGILLLVAAVLKGHQLSSNFHLSSLTIGDVFSVFVVLVELALSFALLFGRSTRFRFWAPVLFFFGAVLFSGAKAFSGEASCGCFGAVQASPWLSMAIALTALIAFFALKSGFKVHRSTRMRTNNAFSIGVSCLTLGIIFAVVTNHSRGTPLAWLGGETVLFANDSLRFEIDVREPCERRVSVQLENTALVRQVSIVGFRGSDGDTVDQIPFTLRPGEKRTVNITLRWPGFTASRLEFIYDAVREGTAPFDQIESPCVGEFRFVLSDSSVTRNYLTINWLPSLEYISELKRMSPPAVSGGK